MRISNRFVILYPQIRVSAIFAILFLSLGLGSIPGIAQSQPAKKVRIEFRGTNDEVLKIVEVRGLDHEHWLQDFEVECKNVSAKPIFFIFATLYVPIVKPEPTQAGFQIFFGNMKLINNAQLGSPDDVSYKPGETFVLKIAPEKIIAYDQWVAEGRIQNVTKIFLDFNVINFGDGTGLSFGSPVRPLSQKRVETFPDYNDLKRQPATKRKLELQYLNEKLVKIIEVRNLDSEHWPIDLEFVLQNTSEKPIYLFILALDLPQYEPLTGSLSGFDMQYGDIKLINNDRLANPTDVPIKPGEVFVMKISTESAVAYQNNPKSELPPTKINTLRLRFYVINFGDGTGYIVGQPARERVHKP